MIYFGSFEGETHFGMPGGAKMSLTLNALNWSLIQIQTQSPSMHHRWKEIISFGCRTPNG